MKTKSSLSDRYSQVIGYFRDNVPEAKSELNFENTYQLLVAVMLSAQCTDKRVNLTTPALFERYPDIESLAAAPEKDILELIGSISYPNSKAAHMSAMARKVRDEFKGEIPSTVTELMTLPGVGRKTANVVSSIVWNAPVIAVDTHVFRVAHRLGLSKGKTPEAVEKDLERHISEDLRPIAHHWLILHGRYVCKAIKPDCDHCALANCCLSFSKRSSASSPLAPK